MGNATTTVSGGVCTIQTPATLGSMVFIPNTSGNAQWINYCSWSETAPDSVSLGSWSAQMANITIVTNPDSLINTSTYHGTLTTSTTPSVTGITGVSLTFTHQENSSGPILPDDLQVIVINVTDNVTYITIMAEDRGDQNYLDFNMAVLITDNPPPVK